MVHRNDYSDDESSLGSGNQWNGGCDALDDLDEPLCDATTERDLSRIVTNRLLMPPPKDADDPSWSKAWAYFTTFYLPALRIYVYRLLQRSGFTIEDAFVAGEDICQDFLCQRLEDGRLQLQAGKIQKFRYWLAKQAHDFTVSWMRKRSAQKRSPRVGFAAMEALDWVSADAPDPKDLWALRDQIALEITRLVLQRVDARSSAYAEVLRDLIRNEGVPSPDLPDLLGRKPHRMADLRRRARSAFREELVDLFRDAVVPEDDIDDLIKALSQLVNKKPRVHAI